MSETPLPSYRPSGRIGWRAWLLFGCVGAAAAVLAGWSYANALLLVDSKPAAVFVAVVFWIALAVFVSSLATRSRSRSPTFNGWAGASVGFIALWVHWVVFLKGAAGAPVAADFLGSGPIGWLRILAQLGSARNENGGLDGLRCAGWALEALITLGFPASIAGGVARDPYSEAEGEWAKPVFKGELVVPGASSTSFRSALQASGAPALLTALPASATVTESVAAEWWTLEIEGLAVDADSQARWLQATILIQTRKDRGGIAVRREPVSRAWHVDADTFDAVCRHVHPADGPEASVPDDASAETESPALQSAVAALERDDFAAAFEIAQGLLSSTEPRLHADALRMCALAASRMTQWNVAFEHYHWLFAAEPTAFNAVQLASTAVCAGNLKDGQSWLATAHDINDRSKEMQPPRIDTAFLSALEVGGEQAAALPILDKLASAYTALPTLDDHFVWSHGLPFFGEFLRKSAPLLEASLSDAEVLGWYARLRAGLSPEGVAMIDAHASQLRTQPAP